VLIQGESGTGKELVARAIHANSRRRESVFFAVDCGTLTGGLLASELFGHTRGAFTGAHQDKEGIFQRAHGGTIFLDEISNTGTEVQGMLLRFLETREFLPVGGTEQRRVDVRLIFATNRDLQELVAAGRFREDFYYRIHVYPIQTPPLRERREDILPIAEHFLGLFGRQLGRSLRGFDAEAVERLQRHAWPGNVRELRNMVERAVILSEGSHIHARDLSLEPVTGIAPLSVAIDPGPAPATNAELKRARRELRAAAVAGVERRFLIEALRRHHGNVSRAARQTGMQRTSFQNLMKRHGIRSAHNGDS
jgi:DNA-binding NtrC family response regulator